MNAPLNVAYFSPLPPVRSGIADYSRELLPHLARSAQVTLFAEKPEEVDTSLQAAFSVRPISDYPSQRWSFDLALYQMGDSMHHDAMYPMLLRYPGLTVLHDYGLHHFIATRTIQRGNYSSYVREMGYALGVEGVRWARDIRQGRREHPMFEVALNERVLDSSLGVIIHSRYAQKQIEARRPNLYTRVIPAPIQTESGLLLSRSELGCPEDALLFASVGQVIKIKQVTCALEAFARLRESFPLARYVVVGEELKNDLDLSAWLEQHGLQDAVLSTGYIPDMQRFVSWIAAADVLINLRYPTVGETSATALRGMAAGRPVIVSNLGWYAELPDEVCVKVVPNDVDAVFGAMQRLASEPDLRHAIGRRAAEYARREHSLSHAAQMYLDFAEGILANVAGRFRARHPME